MEFALLFPVFLLMLMGMAAYGIYLGATHALQQLAADAARVAISGIDAAERETLVAAYVNDSAGSYAFIDPARLHVAAAPSASNPAQFVVSLRYDARQLPIWALLGSLPLPHVTIERQSTIRVGGA